MTDAQILETAKEIHKFYRAASKVLHNGRLIPGQLGCTRNCINEHDHGWIMCHKKKYFLKRAKMMLQAPVTADELRKVPF